MHITVYSFKDVLPSRCYNVPLVYSIWNSSLILHVRFAKSEFRQKQSMMTDVLITCILISYYTHISVTEVSSARGDNNGPQKPWVSQHFSELMGLAVSCFLGGILFNTHLAVLIFYKMLLSVSESQILQH